MIRVGTIGVNIWMFTGESSVLKRIIRFRFGVILLLLSLNINLQAMDDALLAELHGTHEASVARNLARADLRLGNILNVTEVAAIIASGAALGAAKSGDGDADSSGSSSCGDRISVGSHSTVTRLTLALLDSAAAELTAQHLFASSVGGGTGSVTGDSVGGGVTVSVSGGEGDALRESTRSAPPAVSPVERSASATLDDSGAVITWQARVTPHGTHTNYAGTVVLAGFGIARRYTTEQTNRLTARIKATKDRGVAFAQKDPKFDYVGSADGSGPKGRS